MKAIVTFDLDGTLVDSPGDIAAACNHALAAVGRAELPALTIGGFVGDGGRKLLERALAIDASDGPPGARLRGSIVDDALTAFNGYYQAHPAVHAVLLPGALAALDALRGHPLAIATNKSRGAALAVLDALGIRERFAAISAGDDGPMKPDPDCLVRLCRALSVRPERSFMVGDGPQDIGAGRAAGCITVAVLGGFHDEATLRVLLPDHVIQTLHELPALVTADQAARRSP